MALFGAGAVAIGEGAKNLTSYCRTNSGPIYERRSACAAGDHEIDSLEYQHAGALLKEALRSRSGLLGEPARVSALQPAGTKVRA